MKWARTGRQEPKFGLYVPNFGKASHPETLAELAQEAEKSGWDGFFLWNRFVEWDKRVPIYDPFTSLAAIALKTTRIRLGTTVPPAPPQTLGSSPPDSLH